MASHLQDAPSYEDFEDSHCFNDEDGILGSSIKWKRGHCLGAYPHFFCYPLLIFIQIGEGMGAFGEVCLGLRVDNAEFMAVKEVMHLHAQNVNDLCL